MQCVNCGSYLSSSDGTTVEGVLIHDSWYCEDCYVKEFRQCKCGNLFDIKHGGVFSRQQWFCNNCFVKHLEENYTDQITIDKKRYDELLLTEKKFLSLVNFTETGMRTLRADFNIYNTNHEKNKL